MPKIVNLLGIRNKATLCRIKQMGNLVYTVLRPITKEQEEEIDEKEEINFDGTIINKDNIYCYGQFDINNKEDINYIKKFNIINLDDNNPIYTNYDFNKGIVSVEGNVIKTSECYNPIEWFKYKYLLIGKPERIIVYKCNKCDL